MQDAKQELELNKSKANKTSMLIVEKKLNNKLHELFNAFDADKNGFITAYEISLDNVTAEILEIYTPLLLEMESYDYKLD